ncbi:hypothetical protein SDRG_11678 [Saprolegnia diclina VS20]|uniref:TIP41-like protein n=1 Tax=Saprolegnia diclina (strain VS20) TaxID=1156394 RepID=T0REA7_SAPDV|nr:hypothetical protein SDRG_11678 [Saprolegnia diclina VS20]EQC30623.1 hypothetical protein SDRG_11678 [Saprolegnia diclina VS20]|eukprot:XP_008615949.1 hypothetical protein SDRG_11678 [Saprolegnia diclina VS20]
MSGLYYDRETGATTLLGEARAKLSAAAAKANEAAPDGIDVFQTRDWTIAAKKSHITPLHALDSLGTAINMTPPEMVFGHNQLLLVHEPSGFSLSFVAMEALAHCHFKDGATDQLKVAVAKEKTGNEVKELEISYDWTYTTDYKGTLGREDRATHVVSPSGVRVEPTTERIDFEKLKVREPILWSGEVNLYEDELHDHGISVMSLRMRVMPSGFYVLARYYMRLDNVLVRLHETRIHHLFGSDYMLREYTEKEAAFEALFAQGHPNHMSHYTNVDTYQHLLSTKTAQYEKVFLQ